MIKKFLVLIISLNAYSQSNLSNQQISDLTTNIICYSIRYSNSDNYKQFYPEKGWQLNLKINKLDMENKMINSKYDYYEVINDNFSFVEINGRMSTQKIFTDSTPLFFKLSKFYLVAINENNEILYLGGNFYKTSIADSFNLSVHNSNLFNNFLKIKLYNFKVENFEYIKKNNFFLFFKGFSYVLGKNVKVKISKSNFDNIFVEY
jgi:hypothetical protein